MEFSDYQIWKFLGLVLLVFVVNLVYTFFTGRSIEEAREEARRDRR